VILDKGDGEEEKKRLEGYVKRHQTEGKGSLGRKPKKRKNQGERTGYLEIPAHRVAKKCRKKNDD